MRLWRRYRRQVLRGFELAQRPAAWVVMVAGAATFVSVAVGLVVVGTAKLATLLIAADLVLSAAQDAARQAEDDEEPR